MSRAELQAALAYERARANRLLDALLWTLETVHRVHHVGAFEHCSRVCLEGRTQLEWVEP
jgi:hypothetical protein